MNRGVILYVEDEVNDVLLLSLAFESEGYPNLLASVVDGVEAIEYLAGEGRFADRLKHPFPDLLLLDLNLPKKSGFEVLEWARGRPELASLPIVIFTSSQAEVDRNKAFKLGATDYIIKFSEFEDLAAFARSLAQRHFSQIH